MDNYKAIRNRNDHRCFGCGPKNASGLKMKFFTDDTAVYSQVVIPEHLCGWDNLVHGGAISTMLDEIMSWSAIYLLRKIILTKSITIDFKKPLHVKDKVLVKGRVKSIINEKEAMMLGYIYDENERLCAKSTGTFALITPKIARRMGLMSQEAIDNFRHIVDI